MENHEKIRENLSKAITKQTGKKSGGILHLNFMSKVGQVYCRKLNRVAFLDDKLPCMKDCPYFNGTLQGKGVECLWEDPKADSKEFAVDVYNPQEEYNRLNKA